MVDYSHVTKSHIEMMQTYIKMLVGSKVEILGDILRRALNWNDGLVSLHRLYKANELAVNFS